VADKGRLPSPPGYCTAAMAGMSCVGGRHKKRPRESVGFRGRK
jgi:hypothetical protein